jgi:CRP-like cAMP-binding protein
MAHPVTASRPSPVPRSTGAGRLQGDTCPCTEVLRSTPLFAGLSVEQLQVLSSLCREAAVCTGGVFFCQGDHLQELFVVLDGEVWLEQELTMGPQLPTKKILVEKVGKNGVFGLCAIIPPEPSKHTARCTGDAKIIAINSDELMALMKAHSDIGFAVMSNAFKIAVSRLERSHARIITELGLPTMYSAYRNY